MLGNLFYLLVATCASYIVATGVQLQDYNYVRFEEFESLQQFKEQYMNGDGGRVNHNLFIGVATEECHDQLYVPAFVGSPRYSAGDTLHSVTLPAKEFPYKINGCAEVFFYRSGDKFNNPRARTADLDHRAFTVWAGKVVMVKDMTVINNFPFDVILYWHDEAMEPREQGFLKPGESLTFSTFLGHVFSANRADPDPERELVVHPMEQYNTPAYQHLVDFFVVDEATYRLSPVNRMETCEEVSDEEALQFVGGQNNLDCSDLMARFVAFSHKVWHSKRLALNYVQPKLVPPVTTGFEHRKLPVATYKWLKEWYDNEKRRIEESETSSGPCMNQYEAPSLVTHLTAEKKEVLERELQPILEDWFGGDLFLTSIYGIRKYTNGSVLRMHVDTVNTHVVSAIINVDQEVDQDWPLLILDHDGNEHNLIMKPGDMVLYESARLLHGRPEPFQGKHYDNIFIHFSPVSGWDYSWV